MAGQGSSEGERVTSRGGGYRRHDFYPRAIRNYKIIEGLAVGAGLTVTGVVGMLRSRKSPKFWLVKASPAKSVLVGDGEAYPSRNSGL